MKCCNINLTITINSFHFIQTDKCKTYNLQNIHAIIVKLHEKTRNTGT